VDEKPSHLDQVSKNQPLLQFYASLYVQFNVWELCALVKGLHLCVRGLSNVLNPRMYKRKVILIPRTYVTVLKEVRVHLL
jgi:hypothetical protein